jgi:hypothetical protein
MADAVEGARPCPPSGASLPVVRRRQVEISDGERAEIEHLASALLAENRHLSSLAYFGPGVTTGLGPAPSILIGDKSEIPLLSREDGDLLEYRIALLAGHDDLIVFTGRRNPEFETYLCGLLDLAALNFVEARPTGGARGLPLARRCIEEPAIRQRLLEHVRENHGATLLPHIATGSIWALAKSLNEETGEPIRVAGPPPNLSAKVNDKIWFADTAVRLLGEASVPPTLSAFGPAALTGHVRRLARKWEKVVVKLPHSAGSAGNLPIRSAAVSEMGAGELHEALTGWISAAGWPRHYPLMVEVWDCNVLASPSVQVWIPDQAEGDPVIEGVFDQILSGEEGRFIGAAPTEKDVPWEERICRDAMKLALLFQRLGYFGRSSFDTIISGSGTGDAAIHWIECNGRWGGVSLPMTFLNRLFAPDEMPAYIIVQRTENDFPALPFQAALDALGDEAYRPGAPEEGVILVTPGALEAGVGLHMIALDRTLANAKRRTETALQLLRAAGSRQT